jgi:hypothetical protein
VPGESASSAEVDHLPVRHGLMQRAFFPPWSPGLSFIDPAFPCDLPTPFRPLLVHLPVVKTSGGRPSRHRCDTNASADLIPICKSVIHMLTVYADNPTMRSP